MKVVTIAGPKGGCGKSTLTASLSVRASAEAGKVAMIDLNMDQGTLSEWWVQRGRPSKPCLYDAEGTLDQMIHSLNVAQYSYCFIDGPPYEQDLIEMSVIVGDAILIPVKLSYFDASAIDSITGMCQRRQKPYAFVVNEFDDRKLFANANAIALKVLDGRGPILKSRVSYHPKYRVGLIDGQAGAELDSSLAKEIDLLWTEVKEFAGIGPSLKAVEGGHVRPRSP
jgi:chromosome partitioning protein